MHCVHILQAILCSEKTQRWQLLGWSPGNSVPEPMLIPMWSEDVFLQEDTGFKTYMFLKHLHSFSHPKTRKSMKPLRWPELWPLSRFRLLTLLCLWPPPVYPFLCFYLSISPSQRLPSDSGTLGPCLYVGVSWGCWVFIVVPKWTDFSWTGKLGSWHVFGIWFFSWVGLFGHPSGAEASVPLVLLCEGMALAVSALVDPAWANALQHLKYSAPFSYDTLEWREKTSPKLQMVSFTKMTVSLGKFCLFCRNSRSWVGLVSCLTLHPYPHICVSRC